MDICRIFADSSCPTAAATYFTYFCFTAADRSHVIFYSAGFTETANCVAFHASAGNCHSVPLVCRAACRTGFTVTAVNIIIISSNVPTADSDHILYRITAAACTACHSDKVSLRGGKFFCKFYSIVHCITCIAVTAIYFRTSKIAAADSHRIVLHYPGISIAFQISAIDITAIRSNSSRVSFFIYNVSSFKFTTFDNDIVFFHLAGCFLGRHAGSATHNALNRTAFYCHGVARSITGVAGRTCGTGEPAYHSLNRVTHGSIFDGHRIACHITGINRTAYTVGAVHNALCIFICRRSACSTYRAAIHRDFVFTECCYSFSIIIP